MTDSDPTRALPRRRALGHFPTPLQRCERLDALVGCELWIKRDDADGGAEAGNKLRKLEFLLAEARPGDTVLTCGGLQSNHCRATALVAARLGLACEVFLRTAAPDASPPATGNVLLSRLAGATIHLVSADQYRDRERVMGDRARAIDASGGRAIVIPEGGSNALGALGYVGCVAELKHQWPDDRGPVTLAHACGSGGTAAGLGLGLGVHQLRGTVHGMAVCDDRHYFEAIVGAIISDAREQFGLPDPGPVIIHDAFKGPAYGVASQEQLEFVEAATARAGVVLDPVYSGKALFGLAQLKLGVPVVFVHTGGLPGLLAQGDRFAGRAGLSE